MKASIDRFKNHHGKDELRLFFPTWEVDGRVLKGVNILPHRCDPAVCEYGDHVHIEVYDDPEEIIAENAVELSEAEEKVITAHLRTQLAVDQLVDSFERYIKTAT